MIEHGDGLIAMYGANTFDDSAMRKYLPGETYRLLRNTISEGRTLDPAIADAVASGMKRWALDKGATHFTHWFQPMTGYTAEKHESFINPQRDGTVIMSFSGKELVRGEADASSFPSGGMRATFEARGYTAWDCTSPAFVKEGTLCIPTCFFSFNGDSLDKKTPLLRSMEALSRQAVRVLRAMGDESVSRVISMSGAEQEYFLVRREQFLRRRDLMLCGRTLFGAPAAKGQELCDHYYGMLDESIGSFMRQADEELWSLGVPAKTEHNEAAPAQHELASVYTTSNIACDNNQLIMETLKKVALRNGMVCLLHEKPYDGVNGSGKHNNWSLSTGDGRNLLSQGDSPEDNARFLLFLSAFIQAVDEHAALLRMTVAGPGNDRRLGGHEAPPAVISIFLGDMLTDILMEIETGGSSSLRQGGSLQIGVSSMPALPQDISDRNRTSPMAYTGNKFEFRMPGSSMSIADCNTVTNLIMCDALSRIADRLEKCEGDVNAEVRDIIRDIMREHKRVIFNGNNYSREWAEEAERRGLPVLNNSVDAFEAAIAPSTFELFERFGVLTRRELEARYGIYHDNYVNTLSIEAKTMAEMAGRQIMPAVIEYTRFLADTVNSMRGTGLALDMSLESGMLKDVTAAGARFRTALSKLEKLIDKASGEFESLRAKSVFFRDKVCPAMDALREAGDKLELLLGDKLWPMPSYTELMFGENA